MGKRFLIIGIVLGAFIIALFSVGVEENTKLSENPNYLKEGYEPIVVLELFTSQGCSSCPAADNLLNDVKQLHPENVFTLSYHVDYWNYIGWKDPFSKEIYSDRQTKYNKKLKYRGNYTPEVVVNGKSHFTGSNRGKMNLAITDLKNKRVENQVSIVKSEKKNAQLAFDYAIEGNIDGKDLRAVLVLDERTTNVKRGENRNRRIKNGNIVVAESMVTPTSEKGSMVIELPELVKEGERLSLLLLVSNQNLDITAAGKIDFQK